MQVSGTTASKLEVRYLYTTVQWKDFILSDNSFNKHSIRLCETLVSERFAASNLEICLYLKH